MIFPDDPNTLAELEKQARQIAAQIKVIKDRAEYRLQIGGPVTRGPRSETALRRDYG
jgi:hypothetical protein